MSIEMSKGLIKRETKDKIIPGEEKLFEIYDARNVAEEKNVVVGIDGGSTQTRVLLVDDSFDNEVTTEDYYVIPSDYAKLDNERVINPKTDKLYGLLDSFIVDKNNKVDSKIGRVRVVRGTKLKDSNVNPIKLTSTDQKIEEPIFYTNIVDSIGYALIQKYGKEVPTKVNVIAGIALPPDDNKLPQNRDKFKKNLLGGYEWTHRESGVKVDINILGAETMTEPEAFIEGYYTITGEEIPERQIVINTGGRSIGIELLENGTLIDAASVTLAYGGNQFANEVGSRIIESENNTQSRLLPLDKLKEIVVTGQMQQGKNSISVTDEIAEASKSFAETIFNDIRINVIDTLRDVDYNSISEVIVCGGLVRRGDYDISITDYLCAMFKDKCEFTDFTVVEENYIPVGLMIEPLNSNLDFIFGEEEEESEEELATSMVEGE